MNAAPQAPAGSRAVIAVDGPSGTGKSTVARTVAKRLGLRYLDTGALYRALTWAVLTAGADPSLAAEADAVAARLTIDIGDSPEDAHVSVREPDGVLVDVTRAIRSAEVTAAVSLVSAHAVVRERLVMGQRAIIGRGGIVVEGRDIGTVVAPDATVKVYLTAAPEVRAARRAAQDAPPEGGDRANGLGADDLGAVREAMARRDLIDSTRPRSPLRRADDAIEIDTSMLTFEQVVDQVIGLIERSPAWS